MSKLKKVIIALGVLLFLGIIIYGVLVFKYGEKNLEYKYGDHSASVIGLKNKENVTDIIIPNKVFKGFRFYDVLYIDDHSFENCQNLKSVRISKRYRKHIRLYFL